MIYIRTKDGNIYSVMYDGRTIKNEQFYICMTAQEKTIQIMDEDVVKWSDDPEELLDGYVSISRVPSDPWNKFVMGNTKEEGFVEIRGCMNYDRYNYYGVTITDKGFMFAIKYDAEGRRLI